MNRIKELNVLFHNRKVGKMKLFKNYFAAFEYDKEWLLDGFAINPFLLPLKQQVFVPKQEPFDGLFGAFADSLPDGWGRLLVDRLLLQNNINPIEVNNLDRLSIVGHSGMGALAYEPDYNLNRATKDVDLDILADECSKILRTNYIDNVDELFKLGGSSGGARPKILTTIDDEEWIIKFPSTEDKKNIGKQEYDYSLCAKECGIRMMETKLFASKVCEGYFGTKRFDRIRNQGIEKRVHMLSVSGLLETSHRIPNLDYDILMKLTLTLTKEFQEVEQLYRLMCFNVFAHNRDDHSKNFTFLYNDEEFRWVLSPAYDLTYSYSIGGEHATTVHGNGRNPQLADVLEVAKAIGIGSSKAKIIACDIQECVNERLKAYLRD